MSTISHRLIHPMTCLTFNSVQSRMEGRLNIVYVFKLRVVVGNWPNLESLVKFKLHQKVNTVVPQ